MKRIRKYLIHLLGGVTDEEPTKVKITIERCK